MRTPRTFPGTTLPELLIALAVLSILVTLTAPRLAGALDGHAVRGARDGAAALFSRARALALARGTAEVRVDLDGGRMVLASPAAAAPDDSTAVGAILPVAVATESRTTGIVVLRFDALGIGRFANHTFVFSRGRSTARLTLSSYGRPRRW